MSSFIMFFQQAAAPAAGAAPAGDGGMSLLANLMLPVGMIVIPSSSSGGDSPWSTGMCLVHLATALWG